MNKKQRLHISQIDSTARTKLVKHHISLTFIYRALAIGLSYLLVPLTISYLDIEQYGIWMTLLSIMSWVTFFDIGLGNGMRNKLTESLAVRNIKLAKTYVSTTYALIGFIAFVFVVILVSVSPFIPWNKIFNTTLVSNTEFAKVVLVVGFFFILNLILSLNGEIFNAYQQASVSTLNLLLLNLFAVVAIYVLVHYTSSCSLLYLSVCYGSSMMISGFLLTYYLYIKHCEVRPSVRHIDISKIRDVSSLGIKFFILKLAVLIIFTTDNLIITQVLGPEHVAPYNIVFKLFALIIIGHSVLVGPLWSAYTEAFTKGDIGWIRNILKKLNMLLIPLIIIVSILIFFAGDIIKIWVGPDIKFPYSLVVLMGVYTLVRIWNSNHSSFLNGISKINIQVCTATVGALINIPISVYCAKNLDMGISGVILGSIISLSIFSIIGPIQSYYVLNKAD